VGENFGDELSQVHQQIQSVRARLEQLQREEEDLSRRVKAMPPTDADEAAEPDVRPSHVDLPLHSSALPPAKARALHRLLVEDRVGAYTLAAAAFQALLALTARCCRRPAATTAYLAAVMIPARLLRNRFLLALSMVLLALAMISFLATALQSDPSLTQTMMSFGGLDFSRAFTLALLLAAAGVLAAAMLGAGEPIWGDEEDGFLIGAVVWVAFILWAWHTAWELPVLPATWAWLALAASIALLASGRRLRRLRVHAAGMLALTVAKFLLFDTTTGLLIGPEFLFTARTATAVALILACVIAACRFGRNTTNDEGIIFVRGLMASLAVVLIIWTGTIEIARVVPPMGDQLAGDISRARHMASSLCWVLCALVLLGIGPLRRMAPLRYLALGLLAVTAAKVLLIDLAHLAPGYRIAFLASIGVALVLASRLYQHHLPAADTQPDSEQEASEP